MKLTIPFVGGSNTSRSVQFDAQVCKNWYPEMDRQAKYQMALYSRPGLVNWSAPGSAEVRGMVVFGDNLYAVVGGDLHRITSGGVATFIGSIATSSGVVGMAVNPTQIIIVDGVQGYTSDGSTLTAIADTDFPDTATHVVYHDGYFVVNDLDNDGRFWISALNDGTSWDALDFATAQRSPDALLAVVNDHRDLWLLGLNTTEVWYNSGNPDFPFEPVQGGFTEWGIQAPRSLVKLNDVLFWLGRSADGGNVVLKAPDRQGQRISTHAIEEAIDGYSTTSDAIGMGLEWRGHFFYVLTFPTGNATWVFDDTTGLWHEWGTYGVGRFRGNCHAFFAGMHLFGDYQSGVIWEMSDTAYTDGGNPIERIRQDRHVIQGRMPVFHHSIEIELESGVGTSSLDPKAMLQWSDDGGHVFSNEHWRGFGKVGQYSVRAIWRNLGRSRDRVYRLKVTDAVKATVVGAYLNLEVVDDS